LEPCESDKGGTSDAEPEWPVSLRGDIREALSHIPAPAYILDRNGVVRWENTQALEVFGDHRGRSFTVLVAPEFVSRSRLEFTRKVLGSSRTSDYQTMLRTRAGGIVPVEIRAVTLRDGDRVTGIFGIVTVPRSLEERTEGLDELTPRQHEVLQLLAGGYSTKQVAKELSVAPETVRNHVRGILHALGVHSRVAAIAEGRRRGLVP
jgi:PAS domain S-box-containing protein